VENCLSSLAEPHFSHFGLALLEGTSFSNACPHLLHMYSYIGMGLYPKLALDVRRIDQQTLYMIASNRAIESVSPTRAIAFELLG
jgi:hypothetical protein